MLYSPLRYPGGKNKLSAFIAKVCMDNKIDENYIEPYSGGAAVALFLLFEGHVRKITLNDKDKAIYAFWHSVLNETDRLCQLIEEADLTLLEWRRQREIQYNKEDYSLLELGFSTFYLNRTNRSGIILGGIMGGVNQDGDYLMDCRFNKPDLILRIKKIASKKNRITLYNLDALDLIDKIQSNSKIKNCIYYFDPPYYHKADSLYLNHYKPIDHKEVSDKIKTINNHKWIVSYDNVVEIQKLYSDCPKKEFSFKHTAYEIREGKEILFLSKNILQPEIENWNPLNFKRRKTKTSSKIIYQKPKPKNLEIAS
ncbi:DNA adenine methylase [Flagellimonas crocea]|uniref:DNA adenine methylase n=1 Tax=Flagellimonas crocea TaxID=3067311 RepID=UPI00296E370C|nr:DNA adenine methylase [Muricauda sp. DH64]